MASPAKVFRNMHKDIHKLNVRGTTTKPSYYTISTFPHDSSPQQDTSLGKCTAVRGHVEKQENLGRNGPAFLKGKSCTRQVFSTEEVASSAVESFKSAGIHTKPFRCPQCRLIHLQGIPA